MRIGLKFASLVDKLKLITLLSFLCDMAANFGLPNCLQGIDDRVLVEMFLEGGSEFTAIVLDVGSVLRCHPVVLLPTEV